MSAVTPLPCPFCGWEALVEEGKNVWFSVCCENDPCWIQPEVNCDDKGGAIARWNTRALVADPAAQRLALADTMPDQPDLADRLRALAARERGA